MKRQPIVKECAKAQVGVSVEFTNGEMNAVKLITAQLRKVLESRMLALETEHAKGETSVTPNKMPTVKVDMELMLSLQNMLEQLTCSYLDTNRFMDESNWLTSRWCNIMHVKYPTKFAEE